MSEAIFRISTEYSVTDFGLLTPRGGVAMAVVGYIATEHLREEAESVDVQLGDNDGIVLVSPSTVLQAARQYQQDELWRQQNPQEAARQDLPKLILP